MAITGQVKNHRHNLKDLAIDARLDQQGYLHLPNGLLFQWGLGNTGSNNSKRINFPKPFRYVFTVVAQTLSNGDANYDLDVNWQNTQVWAKYAYHIRYFAIGLA